MVVLRLAQVVGDSQVVAHVKMSTAQRMTRRRRKRLKNAKKARQAIKLNKKVARLNKGENPSPRLKTNIIPKLEITSETEVINGPDNVTKS